METHVGTQRTAQRSTAEHSGAQRRRTHAPLSMAWKAAGSLPGSGLVATSHQGSCTKSRNGCCFFVGGGSVGRWGQNVMCVYVCVLDRKDEGLGESSNDPKPKPQASAPLPLPSFLGMHARTHLPGAPPGGPRREPRRASAPAPPRPPPGGRSRWCALTPPRYNPNRSVSPHLYVVDTCIWKWVW